MKDCLIIALASIVIGVWFGALLSDRMERDAIDLGYFESHGQFYRVTKMDAPNPGVNR